MDQNIINMMRKQYTENLAKELCSVQPMDDAGKAFGELYNYLKDTNQVLTIVPREKDHGDN